MKTLGEIMKERYGYTGSGGLKEAYEYAKRNNNILTDELIATLNPLTEEIREDEKGRDIFCKKCGQRRTCFGFTQKVRCVCSCQRAEDEAHDAKIEEAQRQRKIANMRITSLLGDRYRDARFEKTQIVGEAYEKIFNRCRKYCDVADICFKKGYGIYLYGESGVGKTHLTACMANVLIEAGYSVLFTNFADIAKAIKATYDKTATETEQKLMNNIAEVAFLFIDDFGTEKVKSGDDDNWLQEKVFDVVNSRYNRNRPIIFTSNYTTAELEMTRGIAERTIQRINEMCEPMELIADGFRDTRREQKPF